MGAGAAVHISAIFIVQPPTSSGRSFSHSRCLYILRKYWFDKLVGNICFDMYVGMFFVRRVMVQCV